MRGGVAVRNRNPSRTAPALYMSHTRQIIVLKVTLGGPAHVLTCPRPVEVAPQNPQNGSG